MRNANNNFTVEALVAKYYNYVFRDFSKYYNAGGYEDIPCYDPYAGLLVELYRIVAGKDADERVLSVFSNDYSYKFQKDGLEKEELAFLCEHFKEVVAYEFSDRCSWRNGRDVGAYSQCCDIIKDMAKPEPGQVIFIADASDGDVATLFPNCTIKGFTGNINDHTWALGQIRLYAAGINSEIVVGFLSEDDNKCCYTLPEEGSVDMVVFGTTWWPQCDSLQQLYRLLKEGGKMFIFAPDLGMAGKGYELGLRQQLVKDKSIHTIVSFEVNSLWGDNHMTDMTLLYIEKRTNEEVKLVNMKRQTSKVICSDLLDPEILWPSYYEAVRPKNGVPLSKIVTLPKGKRLIQRVNGEFVLPDTAKDMGLVLPSVLSDTYMGANLGNVPYVTDPAFTEKDWVWFGFFNEPSVFIDGNTELLKVGYAPKVPQTGVAYAYCCRLVPRNGFDVRYIAALLFDPSVKEQILTVCNGSISSYTLSPVLDKIIVPKHNKTERLSYLAEANYKALIDSQDKLRQEAEHYRKAVRMRKHALTQSLSAIRSMFYALNAYRERQNGTISDDEVISRVKGTTVQRAFDFISKNLKDMMPVLEHIADVEYSFEKPMWIDPEEFMEGYIAQNENGWLDFKPVITWKNGNNRAKCNIPNNESPIIKEGEPMVTFQFPKDALGRIFKNIIANAQSHGFTDKARKDYQLRFSWHIDGGALSIEIENNGTPIPEDRDVASLLEYGVSSALHYEGHNGIGCNEIDDIMKRYSGKVEIVSSPQNEYTVKYVLTFNRVSAMPIDYPF